MSATATGEEGPWSLPARLIRPGDTIRLDGGDTAKVTNVNGDDYVTRVVIETGKGTIERARWAPVEITDIF